MSKRAQKYAQVVAKDIQLLGVSQKRVTDLLGCGSTLISMYSGKEFARPASETTEFILERLANRYWIEKLLSPSCVAKAQKKFPSAKSVVDFVGLEQVSKDGAVSKQAVKNWVKKYPDLWTPLLKPRVAIAVLRLLALAYMDKVVVEDAEADLFTQEPEKTTTPPVSQDEPEVVSIRELTVKKIRGLVDTVASQLDNLEDMVEKNPEIAKREDFKLVMENTREKLYSIKERHEANVPTRKSKGKHELAAELRGLADMLETVDPDEKTRQVIEVKIGGMRGVLRKSLDDRKKKIEEELAVLRSLGV